MSVIVIQFITLDGLVSDPDRSGGAPTGDWAFRHGPETVAEGRATASDAARLQELAPVRSMVFVVDEPVTCTCAPDGCVPDGSVR